MKHNGHFTFQCVIDCWGVYLAIPSCNVVATHGFSNHHCVPCFPAFYYLIPN